MKKEKATIQTTQSVTRALAILSCFSDKEPVLRVSDFTKKLNLTQSNVSRLLSTMVQLGYVVKDEFSGSYRLGPEIVTLGGIALNNYEIRRHALPELFELENKVHLDSNLAILDGNSIFYLAHVDHYKSPRMYTFVGRRNAIHCTGIGKVLLAHMPEEKADELLRSQPLGKFTDHTITEVEAVKSQFATIRKHGYALEREELILGRACLAAPVFDNSGEVIAGISISGSISKLTEESREQLSQILVEMAGRVSSKMGFFN